MPRADGSPSCGDDGGRKQDGTPCGRHPIRGLKRCERHTGMKKRDAKAKGAIVVEVMRWGLGDTAVDPGETLLRLLSQSSARAEKYAGLLEADYGDSGTAALIGVKLTPVRDADGAEHLEPTEEYLRGLVELEAQERDRCARFAKLALDAGIAERQIRLAEQLGQHVVAVLRASLVKLGLEVTDALVHQAVADAMKELTIA